MREIKVYFSCGLTGMTEEYKEATFLLREAMRSMPGVSILDFCSPGAGESQSALTDEYIYLNDIHECVANADVVVADILPSFGVGYELGVAVEKYHTPTFMCKQANLRVSKLATGSAVHNAHVTIGQYSDSIMELFPAVKLFLEKIIQQKN